MGRHSTYTAEIAEQICQRIADGEFLRVICRDENMPSWRTVYDWIGAHPEFATLITRARVVGHDAIAEDTLGMLDEEPQRGPDGKIDQGYVQWIRIKAEQRLKLLAKWSPKFYGEKLQAEHSGDIGLTVQIVKFSDEEIGSE